MKKAMTGNLELQHKEEIRKAALEWARNILQKQRKQERSFIKVSETKS